MIVGYHVIFGMYGFWLPNDPRGSWSDFVGSWELFRFGRATKTDERRSVAWRKHNHRQRAAAKRSLAAIAADGAADDDDGLVRVDDGLAHDGDGTRLLHIACKGGSVQVVEALLDFGADVDVQDMFDDAPLHYAAPHNKADVCRVLLTRGANPDATNSDGETPLMKIAISGEALDAATVLLEAGADLELMDVRHNTALDLATDSCDVDMVRFLLGRGAIASEQTRHAARGLRGREYLMRRVPDQVADIINLVGA